MENKVGALTYPDALLKRIMLNNNKDKGQEFVDKNYEQSVKELTWHLIKEQLVKANGIKIDDADIKETAKEAARAQFAQYGMPSAPEDMLAGYAEKILADKDQGQKIYEKLYEVKVVEDVKSKVKVTEKAVSADDFAKLAKEL